jgi:hypothetical protein
MSDFFLLAKEEASYKELFSYTSIQRMRKQPTDAQAADGCTSSRRMYKSRNCRCSDKSSVAFHPVSPKESLVT